ncbi:MAG: DNA-processing protein DprA [Leptolyngbyaceae cyanobacterium]
METNERTYWVAWSTIPKVGPTLLLRIQRTFGALSAAWAASTQALCQVDGIGPQTAEAIAQSRRTVDPKTLLQTYEQNNPGFWTPADPEYPRLLLEIPDPPPVLYYRGQVDLLENQGVQPAVAIVGTRRPSPYGKKWAKRIVRHLSEAGFTIVSGLAAGIDAIAHQSCLDRHGRTIAVVGTGVNIIYPWSNRRIAEEIIDRGLMLSEYPAGTKPDSAHFPQRNRIIAGLCRASLVIEAPLKSGALITARIANDYGRDVYALPGSLDEERSHGCLQLINQGAHMILSEANLLDMLGTIPHFHTPQLSNLSTNPAAQGVLLLDSSDSSKQAEAARAGAVMDTAIALEPNAQKVWESVDPSGLVSLDAIVERCQLPTGETLALLAQLELMGLVTQCPGMMYQRD